MPTATCSGCGRAWTGYDQCHCRTCHAHFSNVDNFDRHGVDIRRGCPDPATLTRTKRDGTVVPVFAASEGPYGITWVTWTPVPRPDAANGGTA